MNTEIKNELLRIKEEIEKECVSQGEIAYLESHKQEIMELGDIVLAQWAGITEAEWEEGELNTCKFCNEIYEPSELNSEGYCSRCARAVEEHV